MNHGYVLIINKKDDITPLRHIVTIHQSYNEEEFASWYYSQYCKLDGDEFIYCPTRKDRDDFLEKLNKERV